MNQTELEVVEQTETKHYIANVGTAMSNFAHKTQKSILQAVDKNGDGVIDGKDFGITSENLNGAKERMAQLVSAAGQGIKSGTDALNKSIADSRLDKEHKTLRPVFAEELSDVFIDAGQLPNMIRVVERDKKRAESTVCEGSVGYRESIKGMDILCIYEDCSAQLPLHFHPIAEKGIFYADPRQQRLFVNLDDYFEYLKTGRVNELEMVAQKLGAKHFQITFREHQKFSMKKSGKAEMETPKFGDATASMDRMTNEYASVEIAADIVFSGHDAPVVPELVYFKNESDIEKLIQMRTGGSENRIRSKTLHFKCSKSTGIKEHEAAKIDAVLSHLKYTASESFTSEVQRENHTELEYKIEL